MSECPRDASVRTTIIRLDMKGKSLFGREEIQWIKWGKEEL
jgi:hypothetical protein